MNIKNRAFILVSVVILLVSGLMLQQGISHFNAEIDNTIQEQEKIIDGVAREILRNSYDPYLFKIRFFVEENEQIRQAFADQDRKLLYNLSAPIYRGLHGENRFFHAMDFNLPDGTVFLRVQNPGLFGDNISETRPIVAAVHDSWEQRAGFDIGKHGAIFWVAQPIIHNNVYLGAVEFGIEVKQMEKALAASLNSDVTSVLKGNEWQKAELVKHGFQEHGDYILMTRGNTLFDEIAGQLDFANLEDQRVDIGGKQHILHSCTLLSDFNAVPMGRLVMFQDISHCVVKKKDFITRALLLTLLLILVSFFILYFSFDTLIGRLEAYARENKQAREDLQLAHDTLEDRVKERTVELAKSNARMEDEVTIRRRAEEKLGEQRKFFKTMIESLGHPLYVIDAQTYQVVMANRAACEITGAKSYYGMTCYSLTHHGTEPCGGREHPCPLVAVKTSKAPVSVEHIHSERDGSARYFEIHAYPMFDEQGNVSHIIEYNIDVTGRKVDEEEKDKLRAQLFASQKMEAVGILAGGVAHDFNNILTTILGYSQIMALKLEEENPMREMVEEIYDAAERATGLTRQLLAFSRKQVMEMKVVSLNTIVENISKMLGRLIGEDVEMRLVLTESIPNIKVDAGQVEQVIMNLVINAREAMVGGGHLTIETGRVELDEKYTAVHHGVEPGMYAVLTVTDTGKGMSPEVREKIFEPFYTTKQRDKGTGLGLATVYGIVRQHKGHIYVYSEPEKGTTFKIYLPAAEGSVEPLEKEDVRVMPPGTEAIMVVDDDAAIRRLVRDTLEPLGYSVLEAGSGNDALAVLGRSEEKVDLVLTDLIMPGMNGRELIETIMRDQPGIKAILMSGYTDDIVAHQDDLKPGVIFISKPLLPISLAKKVRQMLDNNV
ncbi:MAG: ATP-binding protein [Desulfobulbaceae bacterium]|nr:ATP-binding protein [Desulfobulbaceae bacterium]